MLTTRCARALAVLSLLAADACSSDDGPVPAADTGLDTAEDTAGDVSTDIADDADAAPDIAPDIADDTDAQADAQTDADAAGDVADDTGGIDLGDPACDPLIPERCTIPWPSNRYLVDDDTTETGYRLQFDPTSLPSNFRGVHIDPTPYARFDGYGPGSPPLVFFHDLDASSFATEYDIAPSLADDAQILFYEVGEDGLERIPYWAELDRLETDPAEATLFVRPAVLLKEGTTYVLAFRDLQTTAGEAIEPSPAFAALVSGETDGLPALAARQPRFDEMFQLLDDAGVARDDLVLAWDWTTASPEALHGDMLRVRDIGLAAYEADGTTMTIDEWTTHTPEEHAYWAVEARGTFVVPDVREPLVASDASGEITGYVIHRDDDGEPALNGTREATFWVGIPHAAMDGTPMELLQFGHGLLGEGDGATGRWQPNGQIANDYGFIVFGCNWTGMADPDYGNVQFMVFDLTWFPWLSEGLHQGMLEFMVLARAMQDVFPTLPEVTDAGVVIDTDALYYTGTSQGGIYGATYMALSPDITRGHLGVPGANYSTLLHRSVDFEQFFTALQGAYRGRDKQAVALSLIQTLWDTVDPVTYWRHLEEAPFDGTPRQVLATLARADWQVSNFTMEVVARSGGGLAVMENYDDERSVELVDETPYPHSGSGMVMYRFGNPWPPAGNLPPHDELGDPHSGPRFELQHSQQLVHFLRTGEVIDVCGGDGCSPE